MTEPPSIYTRLCIKCHKTLGDASVSGKLNGVPILQEKIIEEDIRYVRTV